MDIETFKEKYEQLATVELPYNRRLYRMIVGSGVQRNIEQKLNELFQHYIEHVPKKEFVAFLEKLYKMEDEPYYELQSLLEKALEERIYTSFNLEENARFLEGLQKVLIEYADLLIYDELINGLDYEVFIHTIFEYLISATLQTNQRYLKAHIEELKETKDFGFPDIFVDIRFVDNFERIAFSFRDDFQQMDIDMEGQLNGDILSNRKNLYSMMMLSQGTGVELPKDIELLERPHVQKYSMCSAEFTFSFIESFIDFIAWIVKEFQYDEKFLVLQNNE